MFKKIFVITALILFVSSNCFAAPAGNTSDTRVPYGPGVSNLQASGFGAIKLGIDADWIFERKLDGDSTVTEADLEGQIYLLRLGYTFADRFEPYVKLGVSHLKTGWVQNSIDLRARGENALTTGFGAKALLFEIPEHTIRFTLDGQYIYSDSDIEEAGVGIPERTVSSTEFKITQWQITAVLSKEFILNSDSSNPAAVYSLIPYVGLGYIDSENEVEFTYSGTEYSMGATGNENKFMLITGCDLTSPENMSLNVEGRWIGETAASVGGTVKF